jgi:hypothetical protein
MFDLTTGIGRIETAPIIRVHTADTDTRAALELDQPAVPALGRQDCPAGPGCGRHAGATPDMQVFAGVCDRCGRVYTQCYLPQHGYLCPACLSGGSTEGAPGRLSADGLLTDAGTAPS